MTVGPFSSTQPSHVTPGFFRDIKNPGDILEPTNAQHRCNYGDMVIRFTSYVSQATCRIGDSPPAADLLPPEQMVWNECIPFTTSVSFPQKRYPPEV